MRVIGPDDYGKLSDDDKAALDAWVQAEWIGPLTDIRRIRELDDGYIEVVRCLRDPDGHRYRDGDGLAEETLTIRPREPLP